MNRLQQIIITLIPIPIKIINILFRIKTSSTLSQKMSYDNDGFTRSEKKVGYLGYVGYFSTKT